MVERPSETLSVRRQCAPVEIWRVRASIAPGRSPALRSGLDAADRRIASEVAVLRLAGMVFELNQAGHGINRKRVQRLMRVMGIEALVPRPGTSKAARPQDPSLSAARRKHHRAQSCLGQRHHLYSDGAWLSVSGGDYRLGQPGGSGVALVEHDGYGLLHRGARRSAGRHGTPKYSTPIRARSSPAPPSPGRLEAAASRFRWTDAVVSWTIFSSNGCALDQIRGSASESLC